MLLVEQGDSIICIQSENQGVLKAALMRRYKGLKHVLYNILNIQKRHCK